MDKFAEELKTLLNNHSKENDSNTPDFILANYILDCLEAFDKASYRISIWYDEHQEELWEQGGDHV